MKLMVVYIKEGWPKRWNSFWVTPLGISGVPGYRMPQRIAAMRPRMA